MTNKNTLQLLVRLYEYARLGFERASLEKRKHIQGTPEHERQQGLADAYRIILSLFCEGAYGPLLQQIIEASCYRDG